MAYKTGIEWTDATWNPVSGCTEVSPGCDHCYAKTFAERWRGTPGHYFEHGFDVQLRPDKLDLPLRWRRPRRIFVNSMSDLFHDQVPDDYIARVFAVMAYAHWHTFQILTKRHGRMESLLTSPRFLDLFDREYCRVPDWNERYPDLEYTPVGHISHLADGPLTNVWGGVSAEDQKRALLRIPALVRTPFAVRFVSGEPLLGPIDLFGDAETPGGPWGPDEYDWDDQVGIDWVIVGGESGHGARPMYPGWVRSLRDQCQRAGTPFLFKQWGEWGPSLGRSPTQCLVWPDGTYRAFDHAASSFETGIPLTPAGWCNSERVGKKAAGRELDGRTWDQYPEEVARG